MVSPGPYLHLTKPRIVLLVELTGLVSFLVANQRIDLYRLTDLLVAGFLASSGAGALNSYIDRQIDGKMSRTSQRPIPKGEISPRKALVFGLTLEATALATALPILPYLAVIFIFLGAVDYVLFYTKFLKPRTSLNIVLGGSAGSCAPLAGWAAAVGRIDLAAWMMALLIFVWTPSHFWGLSMRAASDYSKAGIPMLPLVVGEKKAAQLLALNTFLLIPLSLAFVPLGIFGMIYLGVSATVGAILLVVDVKLALHPSKTRAWTAFKISSPYLFFLFVAMAVDHGLNVH